VKEALRPSNAKRLYTEE